MKMMTCRQLAGACDSEFRAETFAEISELNKEHALAMAEQGDSEHLAKMEEMRALMSAPGSFEAWFKDVSRQFEALPEEA